MAESTPQPQPPPCLSAAEEELCRHMHPGSQKLFAMCPYARDLPAFGPAVEGYGLSCVASIGASHFLCRGLADALLGSATYPMLVLRYGIDATTYQRLSAMPTLGWSLKALTAVMCDSFAFFGYTKRWYMCLSCIVGGALAIAYAALPAQQSSANVAAALIFLSSYGKANVDILSEGFYSRLIRKNPGPGSALVSWIQAAIMVGTLVAASISGPLADQGKQQDTVYLSGALQLLTAVIFMVNWYGEALNAEERAEDARALFEESITAGIHEREPALKEPIAATILDGNAADACYDLAADGDAMFMVNDTHARLSMLTEDLKPVPCCLCGVFEFNRTAARRNWRIFVYCAVITVAVFGMAFGNIFASTYVLLAIVITVPLVCFAPAMWALSPPIIRANAFAFLLEVCYISIPGATDPFFLADEACLPGGPHFSFTYFNTTTAIFGTVIGVAGALSFTYLFTDRYYRWPFFATTLLRVLSGVLDITIVKRWNERAGIPDRALYILGDPIVYKVTAIYNSIPLQILISRLAPRGYEGTMYALLTGFTSLGQAISTAVGSLLMEKVWRVDTNADPRRTRDSAAGCTAAHDAAPTKAYF